MSAIADILIFPRGHVFILDFTHKQETETSYFVSNITETHAQMDTDNTPSHMEYFRLDIFLFLWFSNSCKALFQMAEM